jgi:hypothetical protein
MKAVHRPAVLHEANISLQELKAWLSGWSVEPWFFGAVAGCVGIR